MTPLLPPEQRRAVLQARITQRLVQWYEQHLLRLEAEAAGLPDRVRAAEHNMQALERVLAVLERELESLGGE